MLGTPDLFTICDELIPNPVARHGKLVRINGKQHLSSPSSSPPLISPIPSPLSHFPRPVPLFFLYPFLSVVLPVSLRSHALSLSLSLPLSPSFSVLVTALDSLVLLWALFCAASSAYFVPVAAARYQSAPLWDIPCRHTRRATLGRLQEVVTLPINAQC